MLHQTILCNMLVNERYLSNKPFSLRLSLEDQYLTLLNKLIVERKSCYVDELIYTIFQFVKIFNLLCLQLCIDLLPNMGFYFEL